MDEDKNEDSYEIAKEALERSWEAHRQAFGPILEPAFTEDQQARVSLIAALNHISRGEVKRGLELLRSISKCCIYDEDKAAWAFFVGLCFETAGRKEQMLQWYERAGGYGHRFYLPYLKLAKACHAASQFEKALENYETAISCLREMRQEEKDEVILGSVYTNMTSCLTMLYRYEDAQRAWNAALQYPQQPGAYAAAAILYAAMGNEEACQEYIERSKEAQPAWVERTREMTRQILQGEHPHFQKQ